MVILSIKGFIALLVFTVASANLVFKVGGEDRLLLVFGLVSIISLMILIGSLIYETNKAAMTRIDELERKLGIQKEQTEES